MNGSFQKLKPAVPCMRWAGWEKQAHVEPQRRFQAEPAAGGPGRCRSARWRRLSAGLRRVDEAQPGVMAHEPAAPVTVVRQPWPQVAARVSHGQISGSGSGHASAPATSPSAT
ncbi:MAG: hypothetical protein R2854_23650 [Caldilineaceae bacterium]